MADAVLSIQTVRALSTNKVWGRGSDLWEEGALADLQREGATWRATCEGSEATPYRLSLRVQNGTIEDARCSCPYEYEGLCKHLVALACAVSQTPGEFTETRPLLELLEGREARELARLIAHLVEVEPDVRARVERFLTGNNEADDARRRDEIKRLIGRALRMDWGDSWNDYEGYGVPSHEVEKLVREAQSLASFDRAGAGEVYAAILSGLSENSQVLQYDEEGELAALADDCVEGLRAAFAEANTSQRERWVDVALEAWMADLECGGIGFAESAPELLLEADDTQWQNIEIGMKRTLEIKERAAPRRAISFGPDGPSEIEIAYSSWTRKQWVALCAQRYQQRGEHEKARQILIEQGTPSQKARAWLAGGEVEKALHIARSELAHSPGTLTAFADALWESGRREIAFDLVDEELWRERSGPYANTQILEWLSRRARESGHPRAIEWTKSLFLKQPYPPLWTELLALYPDAQRDTARGELIAQLANRFGALFEIARHENNADWALEIWPQMSSEEQNRFLTKLATLCETPHPERAALLWEQDAHAHIARRDRGHYAEAARSLKRARKLWRRLERHDEWQRRIAAVREKNPRLRALHDELKQAGL